MVIRSLRIAASMIFCLLFVSTGPVFAAGFALIEQGVGGLGNAYAGGAAVADDATTVFFNPAGLTRLPTQGVVATHAIIPSFKFKNEGSTHAFPLTPYLRGNNGGNAGAVKVVPNLYYVMKINDRLSAGIGINSPFGLTTEYDRSWAGRYHAVKSELITINVNPSIAYRINDRFSIGAGLNISYAKAELTNAVDFGLVGVQLGLTPQMADGFAELKGDAWGLGWNAGILYDFTKNTRLGLAYRSNINYTLKGDAEFSNVPGVFRIYPTPLRNMFLNGGISAKLKTPDSLSLSLYHSFNPQWAIMGDLTYMGWSSFKELRIEFDNPFQPDSTVTTDWKDVMRYSIGTTYTPNKAWTFRAGLAYDQAPVPSNRRRTPRIPDGDRFWVALGAGYKFSETISVNAAYVHLFINDTTIRKTVIDPEDTLRGGLRGKYSGHVNIVSAELKWVF